MPFAPSPGANHRFKRLVQHLITPAAALGVSGKALKDCRSGAGRLSALRLLNSWSGKLIAKMRLDPMFLFVLWISILGGGFCWLLKYESTPGVMSAVSVRWPTNVAIVRDPDHLTVVMFAHPRCPCTRASLIELSNAMARCTVPVDVHVLFYRPGGSFWKSTESWEQAAAIPGVTARWDDDGVEASAFGCNTSGHTMLFHRDGTLLLSGGLTGARGHPGFCMGNKALATWLSGGKFETTNTRVFGCSLTD